MTRAHPHAGERRPANLGTAGLGLFDAAPIRLEPPSVPSGSSELGADRAKRTQEEECDRILRALLRAMPAPLSRDDLHAATGIPVTNLCARLGPSGPLQTLGLVLACERGAYSAAGNLVIGYCITDRGKRRVEGVA